MKERWWEGYFIEFEEEPPPDVLQITLPSSTLKKEVQKLLLNGAIEPGPPQDKTQGSTIPFISQCLRKMRDFSPYYTFGLKPTHKLQAIPEYTSSYQQVRSDCNWIYRMLISI